MVLEAWLAVWACCYVTLLAFTGCYLTIDDCDGGRWKDWLLASLLLGALGGGWIAVRASRASKQHIARMEMDMEQLRKAEVALDNMQRELEQARLEQENVTTEKKNLEKKLREAGDPPLLNSTSSDLEVSQLKAELEMLRAKLRRAEDELEDRCWMPPPGLQQWLQLTHEIENRAYLRKKQQADAQLQMAREACEKLRKKRSSLVGAFVSTHGKSIDDVDRSIVEARTALNEVTQELQERMHRWKQIERLCGFNIINNSGLQVLEGMLYRNINGRAGGRVRVNSSQDDLSLGDDASLCGSASDIIGWREDSSGSEDHDAPHYPLDLRIAEARLQLEERLAQEGQLRRGDRVQAAGDTRKSPAEDKRTKEPVQFVLGGDNVNWPDETRSVTSQSQPQLRASIRGGPLPPPRRPLSAGHIGRTRSTDLIDEPRPPPRHPFVKQKTVAEESGSATDISALSQSQIANSQAEEESTDSSLMEDDSSGAGGRSRRRRLHLPFGKKAKTPA